MTSRQMFRFGKEDARLGLLCVPEIYTTSRALILAYARGYASERPSLLACQLLGWHYVPAKPAEMTS